MLNYTQTITRTYTENKEVVLQVPKDWGMFTPSGNQAFTRKAKSLVKNVEKIQAEQSPNKYAKKIAAFSKYARSYRKSCKAKSYSEASDTAVREAVWGFMVTVGKAVGVGHEALNEVWDNSY